MIKAEEYSLNMGTFFELEEEKTTEPGFEFLIDVSLDSNNGVFRRYHVGNNPVNWIDPLGLEQTIIGSRGGQPLIYDTNTGQYTVGYHSSYVDPISAALKDIAKDIAPVIPYAAGLATTYLTNNPRLGFTVYEITDTAIGLLFGTPAGIPRVPIDPLINPPCAE